MERDPERSRRRPRLRRYFPHIHDTSGTPCRPQGLPRRNTADDEGLGGPACQGRLNAPGHGWGA
eukprot:8225154-Alexandrium_andersonii.AAC.1